MMLNVEYCWVASHIPYPTLTYALAPQALLKGGENNTRGDHNGSFSLSISFCKCSLGGPRCENTLSLAFYLSFLSIGRYPLVHLNYDSHWIGESGSSNEMLLFALFGAPARHTICG